MLHTTVFVNEHWSALDSFGVVEQTESTIVKRQSYHYILVKLWHLRLHYSRQTSLQNIFWFFKIFYRESEHMPSLSRNIYRMFVTMYRIYKRRSGHFNLIFLKNLLQIDLSYNLAFSYLPMQQSRIESSSKTQMFFIIFDKLYAIDYITVPLIEKLHTFQIVIIQSYISLIISRTYHPVILINFDNRQLIKMLLLRSSQDTLNEYLLSSDVERVHQLPCTYEKSVFVIVLTICQFGQDWIAEQFDT